jgi:hypothetical protein
MCVGYFTMPLHRPDADPGRTMADDVDQLVFLDQLGFEEAWTRSMRLLVDEVLPRL